MERWIVLPTGWTDLKTGENEHGWSIYNNGALTAILLKNSKGVHKIITGAQGSYATPGQRVTLIHDQTRANLGDWTVLFQMPANKAFGFQAYSVSGRKSISGAVFK